MEKLKCPICGIEIEDDTYRDCPYCGWGYTGTESCYDEDEIEDFNKISIAEAKRLVASGKDVFGDPLKK